MEARQIREGIFWMGAVDWDRRLFDSLIPLPDGTSYNAYLVKGSSKTALLDTVDPSMYYQLEAQLASVEHLDYVVAHHGEQDHSGSIPAVLARYRGYVGEMDGEVIVGKRGEDEMVAGVLSAAVGGAAVHGEAALFHTPEEQPDGGPFGKKNLVGKLVLGTSYTFNVGNGLTVMGEYHYSGFGLKNAKDVINQIQNEDFIKRFLRGDSQILGQHALAMQASYPFNETLLGSLLVLGSLTDGSGMVSPSLVWSANENTTVTLSTFLPWGPSPKNTTLRSEYGSSPFSVFAQLSLYF